MTPQTPEKIIEMLMELPFMQCTCNNPTIICKMCNNVNKIREFIERKEVKNDTDYKDKFKQAVSAEKLCNILKETRDTWDKLTEYKKVSLPTAGIRLYAQAIHDKVMENIK